MKHRILVRDSIKERHNIGKDTLLSVLKQLTPNQAAQWVENNVTDLASAKTVLKAMAKVITYFLRNETASDFFSFALDRPTDYLFDYNYLGRSEDSGLYSQQIIIAEGGFKSKLMNPYSNRWMFTTNASFNVWRWIEVFADVGFMKNSNTPSRFVYDAGLRLNLVTDYFELYLPFYSNNGWEISEANYSDRIRFIITLSPKTLTGLFTRKWF